MEFIKTPKISKVFLVQRPSKESILGTLFLTDRKLIFVEQNGSRERSILYHHIENVEQQAGSVRGFPLIIKTKTFLQLHLLVPKMAECQDVVEAINRFSQPLTYRELYAFGYRPQSSEGATQMLGWSMYDTVGEYNRMGVPNEHWRHCSLNEEYKLCDSYTKHLYVPANASDAIITGSAGFRSKERFPVLSYYYKPRKSALCRCSQPLSGIGNRCTEDEELVNCIFKANPSGEPVVVVDTRPKINAMANKAAGKGYESEENYTCASYVSFSIHNIHVMKDSLQKMMEVVHSPDLTVSELLQGLESSGWLRHIRLIMEASAFVVKFICDRGISIIVHCSHGWDRTSQTCALANLWIDPYYRTLQGFMTLIEKEWLSFGHQFSLRCGHLKGESKEMSPIFTQFLECVWQSMLQYPMSFEFNEQFLLLLHDKLYACEFGTFLGNSERERSVNQFSALTYSLWGYVWEHIDDYKNPLYSKTAGSDIIRPDTSIPKLRFWRGLYARHICSHSSETKDDIMHATRLQSTILQERIKFLQQHMSTLKRSLDASSYVFDQQNSTASNITMPTSQSPLHLTDMKSSDPEAGLLHDKAEGALLKEFKNSELQQEMLVREVETNNGFIETRGELKHSRLDTKHQIPEHTVQEITTLIKDKIPELKQNVMEALDDEIAYGIKQRCTEREDESIVDNQGLMHGIKKQVTDARQDQSKDENQEPPNDERQEPPNDERQEPLNAERKEPPNDERQEPLNAERQEPPNAERQEPPNDERQEPPNAERQDQPKDEIQEPLTLSDERQEPLNAERQEPLNAERQEPPNAKRQEPLNAERQEPPNDQRQEPPNDQRQEPPNDQRQEPPNDQRQEPPNDQRQEPPNDQRQDQHKDEEEEEPIEVRTREIPDELKPDISEVKEAISQQIEITESMKYEEQSAQKIKQESTDVDTTDRVNCVSEVRLAEAVKEDYASMQMKGPLDVLGNLRKYTQPIPALKTKWVAFRNVNCCKCGVVFSHSAKKYNCTLCGEVVCCNCGNYHTALQYVVTSNHFRVCKTCYTTIKG